MNGFEREDGRSRVRLISWKSPRTPTQGYGRFLVSEICRRARSNLVGLVRSADGGGRIAPPWRSMALGFTRSSSPPTAFLEGPWTSSPFLRGSVQDPSGCSELEMIDQESRMDHGADHRRLRTKDKGPTHGTANLNRRELVPGRKPPRR
jgi:hypothetical protein